MSQTLGRGLRFNLLILVFRGCKNENSRKCYTRWIPNIKERKHYSSELLSPKLSCKLSLKMTSCIDRAIQVVITVDQISERGKQPLIPADVHKGYFEPQPGIDGYGC